MLICIALFVNVLFIAQLGNISALFSKIYSLIANPTRCEADVTARAWVPSRKKGWGLELIDKEKAPVLGALHIEYGISQ